MKTHVVQKPYYRNKLEVFKESTGNMAGAWWVKGEGSRDQILLPFVNLNGELGFYFKRERKTWECFEKE